MSSPFVFVLTYAEFMLYFNMPVVTSLMGIT